jgi:hypothetical protein
MDYGDSVSRQQFSMLTIEFCHLDSSFKFSGLSAKYTADDYWITVNRWPTKQSNDYQTKTSDDYQPTKRLMIISLQNV